MSRLMGVLSWRTSTLLVLSMLLISRSLQDRLIVTPFDRWATSLELGAYHIAVQRSPRRGRNSIFVKLTV